MCSSDLIEYLEGGQAKQVRATREVLLAGGAINSPQLLMLSGIGDPEALLKQGIRPMAALRGVGTNLQDHLSVGVTCWRKGMSPLQHTLRADRIAIAMLRAYLTGSGPATLLPGGVTAPVRSRADLDVPDLQFLFRGAAVDARPWWPFKGPDWRDAIMLRPVLLHPQSRGEVTLASAEPADAPRIQPNFLAVDADFAPLLAGIRIAREVARQPALDRFRGDEIFPGPGVEDDTAMKAYIRKVAGTFHHACGTCRMGSDEESVVDPQLRVRGIEGLRIVDASVLPDLPGANINACTFMLAEKAADLIRGRTPLPPAAV